MKIDTSASISATEENQNSLCSIKLRDKKGQVVILKNNKPESVLADIEESSVIEMTDDEKLEFVARRIIREHLRAFQELAK